MHIGLIGGIGPAATEFYYRGLVKACANETPPLELTIAHADSTTMLSNLRSGSAQAQADVFRGHVEQLAAAGAEIAAVTSIAGHFCYSELDRISPLPLENALTAVSRELRRRSFQRVGLMGSQVAMETGLYGTITGIEIVLPDHDELETVSREYFAMAIAQCATAKQRELFFSVGARLCAEQGADAVVLAGTDLFLAFDGTEPGFEYIDCAELHIKALSLLSGQ